MNNIHKKTLLGIEMPLDSKIDILEKIKKNIIDPKGFFHIVSLNPEIIVISQNNEEYYKVLSEGSIKLIDGVGVLLGSSVCGIQCGQRITGTDLMSDIIKHLKGDGLRVLFLGGKGDLADRVAKCYLEKYPDVSFKGIEGYYDILAPTQAEEQTIFDEIKRFSPQIIFSSFGSPFQELWFYRHRASLDKTVCMGIGGGLAFACQDVMRAPTFLRQIGLEWLFRLAIQPWRWKRQLRLFTFIYYVLRQKITGYERKTIS